VNARRQGVASMTGRVRNRDTRVDAEIKIKVRVSYGSAAVLGLVRGEGRRASPTALTFFCRARLPRPIVLCSATVVRRPRPRSLVGGVARVPELKTLSARARAMLDIGAGGREVVEGLRPVHVETRPSGIALRVSSRGSGPWGCRSRSRRRRSTRGGAARAEGRGTDSRDGPARLADRESDVHADKGVGAAEIFGALREGGSRVSGRGKVGPHIIVGMGESEESVVGALDRARRDGGRAVRSSRSRRSGGRDGGEEAPERRIIQEAAAGDGTS
jgi:hypothetical protein